MRTCYDFTDQVVLITGAGSGFGRLAAECFAAAGARLALCDINADAVQATARGIGGAGVLAQACDVGDPEQIAALFAAIDERYERLDVAINNAGVSHAKLRLHETDLAMWERVMGANVDVDARPADLFKQSRQDEVFALLRIGWARVDACSQSLSQCGLGCSRYQALKYAAHG